MGESFTMNLSAGDGLTNEELDIERCYAFRLFSKKNLAKNIILYKGIYFFAVSYHHIKEIRHESDSV